MATYDRPGREGPMKLVRWYKDRELIMELPYATEDPGQIELLVAGGCEEIAARDARKTYGPPETEPEPEEKEVT